MRPINRQAGFTAVEIMVVTLIVGVAMLASIPAFNKFTQSNNLNGSGDQMAGHMRLARQMAISEETPYLFIWDNNARNYRIVRDTNQDGAQSAGEPVQGPFSLAKGITLNNAPGGNGFSSNILALQPDGTASESGAVILANDRKKALQLNVLGPTGQVQVNRYTPTVTVDGGWEVLQ